MTDQPERKLAIDDPVIREKVLDILRIGLARSELREAAEAAQRLSDGMVTAETEEIVEQSPP